MAKTKLEQLVDAQKYLSRRIQSYKDGFLTAFKDADCDYLNAKLSSNFSNKDEFVQSLMETIVYRHFFLKGFAMEHDNKLVNGSGKNVDIVATKDGYSLNIEVKCPTVEEKNDSKFVLRLDHKHSKKKKAKEEFNRTMEEIVEDINKLPEEKRGGKVAIIGKTHEAKLKEYLQKANEKFSASDDKSLNVLFLCLTSGELMEHLDYIVNPDTGLFSEKPFLKPSEFGKIDCFVLSSLKSGHYANDLRSKNPNFDIWNIDCYLNFIIPNVAKNGYKGIQTPTYTECLLLSSIKDSYLDYCNFAKNYKSEDPEVPPILLLAITEYYAKNFPLLHDEYMGKITAKLD